jgi:hypothetical protein
MAVQEGEGLNRSTFLNGFVAAESRTFSDRSKKGGAGRLFFDKSKVSLAALRFSQHQ